MSSQVVPFRLGGSSTHAVLNTVFVQEKKKCFSHGLVY